jgi:hypothetical protein
MRAAVEVVVAANGSHDQRGRRQSPLPGCLARKSVGRPPLLLQEQVGGASSSRRLDESSAAGEAQAQHTGVFRSGVTLPTRRV